MMNGQAWLKFICQDENLSTMTIRQLAVLVYLRNQELASAEAKSKNYSSRSLNAALSLPSGASYRAILGLLDKNLILREPNRWSRRDFIYKLTPLGHSVAQGFLSQRPGLVPGKPQESIS